jgi:transmembrane sensor
MPELNQQQLKTAIEWFIALQSDQCTQKQRQQFQHWLAQDQSHQQAYQQAEKLWSQFDEIKTQPINGLEAARHANYKPRLNRQNAILALMLSAGLTIVCQDYFAETTHYVTGIGEQKRLTLEDGSHLTINAASRLSVHIAWFRRQIELHEGEVLFEVSHQSLRPFTVATRAARIKDIGTVFNVRQRREGGAISVLEGEVELLTNNHWSGERLTAGFARRINKNGELLAIEKSNSNNASNWTRGRLMFDHTPLTEVAAELERHHPIHFVFTNPHLAKQTLSGNFDVSDLNPFLQALEQILPIKVSYKKQEIRISAN